MIRIATSTSTSVMPGRRLIVASPLLLLSKPAGARVEGERIRVGATGIDRVGADLSRPREDGDERLVSRGAGGAPDVWVGVAHPEDDPAALAGSPHDGSRGREEDVVVPDRRGRRGGGVGDDDLGVDDGQVQVEDD